MENKKLIKILLKDFADLEELITENESGNFNAVEMEFLTSRVKGAGRLLLLLSDSFLQDEIQKDNKIQPTFETVNYSAVKEPELPAAAIPEPIPVELEMISEEKETSSEVLNFSETQVVNTNPVNLEKPDNLLVIEEKAVISDITEREPDIKTPDKTDKKQVKSVINESQQRLGDTFTKEKSVNELLADQNKLEFKLSNLPVNNIQNAIGINDKFLFIRELFDGDAEKFKSTIVLLDSMREISQAVEYLQQNFKWKKTDASLKFVNLIKRRFPA